MAHYPSEEEQIEALKRWWKENGNSLVIGVLIALAAVFGSRQWQDSRENAAQAASEVYDNIVQIIAVSQGNGISDQDMQELERDYNELRNNHADSIYARYGALMLARVYVDQENYDQAAAELAWVMDNQDLGFMQSAEPELFLTARLRLARVKLAQGQAQDALDLVVSVDPGALGAGFAEVQGDAYAQLGQLEQARGAYQRAMELQPENLGFIELKMLGLSG